MRFVAAGDEFHKRQGANLPHWRQAGATYFVTFRLADSLPQNVARDLVRERDEFLKIVRQKRDEDAAREIERQYARKLQAYLDKGTGEAWMNDPAVADGVAKAVIFFNSQRYDLWAWCVMPNHVHAVVQPREGHELEEILHSWKSFTSNEINRMVGRKGRLWQAEPFDHVVRTWEKLQKFVRYTVENREKAGLRNWRWKWGFDFSAE